MKALNEEIMREGLGIGSDIVKVDMFLNHRLDTGLLFRMGEELAEHFSAKKPDLILTVEASGIALALTAAHAMGDIPMVFAKKSALTVTQTGELATAAVFSFTHHNENVISVAKRYIPAGSRVLIVDDFLADGNAVRGMMELVSQCGAEAVGVGIGIEKGFQPGGAYLRKEGVDLMSLAVIREIRDGVLVLQED